MKKKAKRIAAFVGIAVLIILYLSTLILALSGRGFDSGLFSMCLIGTIIVPILSYVVIFLIDRYSKE